MDEEVGHIQASFFTKEERYRIQDTTFSLPVSVSRDQLSALINQVLKGTSNDETEEEEEEEEEEGEEGSKKREFEFLIDNKLIRGSLESHIAKHSIPTENVIHIEYTEQGTPPAVAEEMEHKDWVSSVHCNQRFILTGCYDGNVRIWSHDGKLVAVASGHSAPIKDVSWIASDQSSSNELLFLSASQDQHIHLWKFHPLSASVSLLHQCKGHARSVEAIAVSPDKTKFCSVSWDKYLKIWSAVPDSSGMDEVDSDMDPPSKRAHFSAGVTQTTTRVPLLTLPGHTQPVTAVVWGREEGEVVSGGWDHCMRLWDVESGVNKSTLTGSKVFHDVDLSSHTQLLASANSDRYIRLWDPRQSESSVVQSSLSSHQGWVVAVAWAPQSPHRLLSGSYDATVRLWDIRSTKLPLFTIAAHEGKVLSVDWSLPRMFASGGADNKLRTFTL